MIDGRRDVKEKCGSGKASQSGAGQVPVDELQGRWKEERLLREREVMVKKHSRIKQSVPRAHEIRQEAEE